MSNPGVAPPDPESMVGQLRYLIGDTQYVALAPPVDGMGDYTNFSDNQLEAYLTQGSGSISRAAGYSYLGLAAVAAAGAVDWRSDDLSVTLSNRAKYLTQLAKFWFDQADADDSSASSDFFAIEYPFGNNFDSGGIEYFPMFNSGNDDPIFNIDQGFEESVGADNEAPFGLHEDPNNPGYYLP